MKNLGELLKQVEQHAPDFSAKLAEIKAKDPSVQWYPFRTLDKVNLIMLVASRFNTSDIGFPGERPRVIDVGSADGDLAFLFESVGCEVVAIDNAASNYNRCAGIRSMRDRLHSNITFVEKDIDYDFSIDGQYDLLITLDILYHLRNPLGYLISLCQLGRYMFLTTRIFDVAQDDQLVSSLPYAYLLAPFEAASIDPTNYWIFTEAALLRLLERSGWRIVAKTYFGYNGNDSSPFEPHRDKRVVAFCERMDGYEKLKYGHFLDYQLPSH